jgi:hypothetical protein
MDSILKIKFHNTNIEFDVMNTCEYRKRADLLHYKVQSCEQLETVHIMSTRISVKQMDVPQIASNQ